MMIRTLFESNCIEHESNFLNLLTETGPQYHPSQAKVQPFAGLRWYLPFSGILGPLVLVRTRESSSKPPAQQSSALANS